MTEIRRAGETRWKVALEDALSDAAGAVDLVGVGNPIRGDDGVGLEVISGLRKTLGKRHPGLRIHPPASMPERMLSKLAATARRVVVFDAVEAAKAPGAIVCSRLSETKYGYFATHNVPLKLVPGLESRKADFYVVGVQPGRLGVGEGLTPAAKGAVDEIVSFIAGVEEAR